MLHCCNDRLRQKPKLSDFLGFKYISNKMIKSADLLLISKVTMLQVTTNVKQSQKPKLADLLDFK